METELVKCCSLSEILWSRVPWIWGIKNTTLRETLECSVLKARSRKVLKLWELRSEKGYKREKTQIWLKAISQGFQVPNPNATPIGSLATSLRPFFYKIESAFISSAPGPSVQLSSGENVLQLEHVYQLEKWRIWWIKLPLTRASH